MTVVDDKYIPCSGNGICKGDSDVNGEGTCDCYPGFTGTLCNLCDIGYYGINCTKCLGNPICNNHGYCDGSGTSSGTGKCICYENYYGNTCENYRYESIEKNSIIYISSIFGSLLLIFIIIVIVRKIITYKRNPNIDPLLDGIIKNSNSPGEWIIDSSRLELGDLIGVGSTGRVFRGRFSV